MSKVVLAAGIMLMMSAPAFSQDVASHELALVKPLSVPQTPLVLRHHTIYLGIANIFGDLSRYVDNKPFSLGYDYTLNSGVILGGYYTFNFINDSVTQNKTSASLDSNVLGIYSGYHFGNGFRATGGLTFTHSEVVETLNTGTNVFSHKSNENQIGINLGVDYIINNIVIGTRFATHKVSGVSGSTIALNLGYQF